MNSYKVLITTSGIGSRLGEITKYTNKALVRIGDKPSISHIIEKYPNDVTFVITLGYFGDQVRDFLEIAYPTKQFKFVNVDKYEGEGSSLLYSMNCAQVLLQEPFIFHACDTIIEDEIIAPIHNWIAGYKGSGSSNYASLSTVGDEISEMHYKGFINCDYLHVGIVGVNDYKTFWKIANEVLQIKKNDTSIGDVDVLKELVKINKYKINSIKKWHDIGNINSLEIARSIFKDNDFHVLDKLAESIFKIDNNVIKFFSDPKILNDRVNRVKYLNMTVPKMESVKNNFYKYEYVKGDLFSTVANRSNFIELIKWAEEKLWLNVETDTKKFNNDCHDFYINKTQKRIKEFLNKKSIIDKKTIINGEEIPTIGELLLKIDEKLLCNGTSTNFHGDFILDNIIKIGNDEFKLIDWRQDFASNIEAGDMYYDLAKLAHNLVVNHEIIDNNQFYIKIDSNGIVNLNIHRLQTLVDCENIYFSYLEKAGYNTKKIKLLRAIIWLNMSPLHHHPFDNFLFYFGKYELFRLINSN
jgi:GTP:adenosylcobinamide-phosphate guanylyltransferase/thiamine kinase-like enzyme